MKILSRREMLATIKSEPKVYNVVCITETFTDYTQGFLEYPPKEVEENAISVLHLSFEDIEFPRGNCIMPKEKDVEKAIEWAQGKDSDNIIVSCRAGVSRSSAIAYLIECSKRKPEEAIDVLKSRHYPNSYVVKLGTELMNNLEIKEQYVKFMNEKGFSAKD